jgi:hypothetical protein
MGSSVGIQTYARLPPGFGNPQDIIQKETGAVFHVDALALQKGFDGRV